MSETLKNLFILDPSIHFLNHGSFGACPRPVFDTYQAWQRQLEHQPVQFMGRELAYHHRQARQKLAEYLHANPDDLVFIPNATYGVNLIARSLVGYSSSYLQEGDEILTTDQEYGACDHTWKYLCSKVGAVYKHQSIPFPVSSTEQFIERFWQGVTPRTKVIYISHITSPTALRLPVEDICHRARQSGILTVIDGAHAPGQIPLDLEAIGADFYTGNCHKWMMSPKGAAFLFTRRERRALVEPLIVSWGYGANENNSSGSRYVDILEFTGTRDPAAVLTVPAAIQFQADHDWPRVRGECHELLGEARRRIEELIGLPPICPDATEWYAQMAAFPLPACDTATLQRRLYDEYRVEVPIIEWGGRYLVRMSVQGYNTEDDVEVLTTALAALLRELVDGCSLGTVIS